MSRDRLRHSVVPRDILDRLPGGGSDLHDIPVVVTAGRVYPGTTERTEGDANAD